MGEHYVDNDQDGLFSKTPISRYAKYPEQSRYDTEEMQLYDFQAKALSAFMQRSLSYKISMIQSGTGTGKSAMIYEAVRRKSMKTCIVAPKKIICNQLLEEFEGMDAEIVVGSKGELTADIIIMTGKTFNSRYEEINGNYGFLVMDECHRCPQKRRDQILMRMGCCILGVTATPKRKEFSDKGFRMLFGQEIDTKQEALPAIVYQVKNKRKYDIDDFEKASQGLSPDSPEIMRRLIIENSNRNNTIVKICFQCLMKGLNKIIVFTDRTAHIDKIYDSFMNQDGFENSGVILYKYHGSADQEKIKKLCKDAGDDQRFIIIGNVSCCGEGFNVPALQVGILSVSSQRSVTIDQAVGRVRREHGKKKHGYLIDMQDTISVGGSKPKSLGVSSRRKIYREKGRLIKDLLIN